MTLKELTKICIELTEKTGGEYLPIIFKKEPEKSKFTTSLSKYDNIIFHGILKMPNEFYKSQIISQIHKMCRFNEGGMMTFDFAEINEFIKNLLETELLITEHTSIEIKKDANLRFLLIDYIRNEFIEYFNNPATLLTEKKKD